MIPSAPGNADQTSLVARLVEGPYIAASDKAGQRLADWLAELGPAQAAALEELLDHPVPQRGLLGIAEFSPYLFALIRSDVQRLIRLLRCEPDCHLAALIETTSREVLAAPGEA